jgi:hypothetical protein
MNDYEGDNDFRSNTGSMINRKAKMSSNNAVDNDQEDEDLINESENYDNFNRSANNFGGRNSPDFNRHYTTNEEEDLTQSNIT